MSINVKDEELQQCEPELGKLSKKLIIVLWIFIILCSGLTGCGKTTYDYDRLNGPKLTTAYTKGNLNEVNSLESWVGNYSFSEYAPPNQNMFYSISIFKENNKYLANISVDGFQTMKRIQAEVAGDEDSIELIFLKYLPDNIMERYQKGDVLLSFKREDSIIYTYWNKMGPMLLDNKSPGAYFSKVTDREEDENKETDIDENIYESLAGENSKEIYKSYLSTLSSDKCTSIRSAYNMFTCLAEDERDNDELFELFYMFYIEVINKIHDTFSNGNVIDDDELKRNGLIALVYEEGKYIFADPKYLKEKFSQYVSEDVKEFIHLEAEEKELIRGFIISDGVLTIERDSLGDLLANWEEYKSKYNKIKWINDIVEDKVNTYIKLYTDLNRMTFSEMGGSIAKEENILKSYRRFVELYPTSKYHELIKKYYEILLGNGVKETEQTRELLQEYGIIK